LIEHVNGKGIYGISFALTNVDTPEIFKSSDVSRRLTYQNIQDFFQKEQNPEQGKEQERATPIDPVIVCYASNPHEWEKDLIYMYPVAMSMALDNGSGKHRKGDEDLPDNKKKKKRNKGLSY